MVDALRNTWAALAPGGTLIDLRPMSARYPIEVVTSRRAVQIGEVDATGMVSADLAADRAMREALDRGWFTVERTPQLHFAFWWDTVREMQSSLDESRRAKTVAPSYDKLEAAYRRLTAVATGPGRLRCVRRMILSSYMKTP